jgi:hypothetical protein
MAPIVIGVVRELRQPHVLHLVAAIPVMKYRQVMARTGTGIRSCRRCRRGRIRRRSCPCRRLCRRHRGQRRRHASRGRNWGLGSVPKRHFPPQKTRRPTKCSGRQCDQQIQRQEREDQKDQHQEPFHHFPEGGMPIPEPTRGTAAMTIARTAAIAVVARARTVAAAIRRRAAGRTLLWRLQAIAAARFVDGRTIRIDEDHRPCRKRLGHPSRPAGGQQPVVVVSRPVLRKPYRLQTKRSDLIHRERTVL